jgi:FkbM family methyltransferase
MKLKNMLQLIGFKGKYKHYSYEVIDHDIGNGRVVHYAQWKHPRESMKVISSDLIYGYSKYISEGDFCVDIGAHSGDTTLPMSVAAGKSGCVLAIEPNPYVYHVLEKNARANTHVGNIKSMLAAATESECFIEFEYSDSGFCNGGRHENISSLRHGHAYSLEVFGVNLENELRNDFADYLPQLKFIKVDAEGYDLYVLKSIKNILIDYSPIVKAEVFKKTSTKYRIELLSLFIDLGYSAYKIEHEPMEIGETLTKENLETDKHFDILCVPNKTKETLIYPPDLKLLGRVNTK